MPYWLFKVQLYLDRRYYDFLSYLIRKEEAWDFGSDEHWDRLERENESQRNKR